jgi:hypothetical protein
MTFCYSYTTEVIVKKNIANLKYTDLMDLFLNWRKKTTQGPKRKYVGQRMRYKGGLVYVGRTELWLGQVFHAPF